MTYVPGAACFRCLLAAPPPLDLVPTCQDAGILGAVAGTLGAIQAVEALKFILGAGELLTNRLLIMDAYCMDFRTIHLQRDPECTLCGKEPTVTQLIDHEQTECHA
jgi:molybdopterin/thiamine biosynthesis adenylyltransferase